ncbi:MAG: hypothetical protein GC159_20160 [Phycisphaera sp.]|nr:hypothetical protein [Phycisphaera sp.]
MDMDTSVGLHIRAIYDQQHEAVGIDAVPSDAFASGEDPKAMIEVLAAITAKANFIAAEVIESWDAPAEHKANLFEHYAALKENMLNDMLASDS